MTIIFDYLFTRTADEFICRVPVRFWGENVILDKGVRVGANNTPGIDLDQWIGRSLKVSIDEGVYTITGLV
ncbi:hypothetical protein GCM10023189_11110 [Nibrella saemangeumensis]|uniref:Uncharacterized protein n=1 Tax=Nibrella saemangeumensis TaxID=1084526 RepID=A0ABP8MGS1_9BACT